MEANYTKIYSRIERYQPHRLRLLKEAQKSFFTSIDRPDYKEAKEIVYAIIHCDFDKETFSKLLGDFYSRISDPLLKESIKEYALISLKKFNNLKRRKNEKPLIHREKPKIEKRIIIIRRKTQND